MRKQQEIVFRVRHVQENVFIFIFIFIFICNFFVSGSSPSSAPTFRFTLLVCFTSTECDGLQVRATGSRLRASDVSELLRRDTGSTDRHQDDFFHPEHHIPSLLLHHLSPVFGPHN
ncbi:unnamed protein product [Pleuronectes platessa]|uniref:Uncharacterized protein n=1 Tax=Pleuronectes platessa TaxID=8262 RepID=A0A9N7U6H7_PLEPL|nr:unnamed protein product [Pleuronectes platessa]